MKKGVFDNRKADNTKLPVRKYRLLTAR